MAKYYCMTHKYKNIVDAPDIEDAAILCVGQLIKRQEQSDPVLYVSERGFSLNTCAMVPIIPIMKKMGIDMPDDEVLINLICASIGKSPEDIDEKELDWLINGETE